VSIARFILSSIATRVGEKHDSVQPKIIVDANLTFRIGRENSDWTDRWYKLSGVPIHSSSNSYASTDIDGESEEPRWDFSVAAANS